LVKRKSPKNARIAAVRAASNAGHNRVEAVAHRVIAVVAVADSLRVTVKQAAVRHRTARVARAALQAIVHRQDRIIARIKPRTNPRINQGSPRARQSQQQVVMPRVVTPRNNNRKPRRKAVAAAVAGVVAVAVLLKTAVRANKQRARVIPLKLEMPAIRRTRLVILRKMMTTVATGLLHRLGIPADNSLKETKRLTNHKLTAIQGSHNRAIRLTRNQWKHALPRRLLHNRPRPLIKQPRNSLHLSRSKRRLRKSRQQ